MQLLYEPNNLITSTKTFQTKIFPPNIRLHVYVCLQVTAGYGLVALCAPVKLFTYMFNSARYNLNTVTNKGDFVTNNSPFWDSVTSPRQSHYMTDQYTGFKSFAEFEYSFTTISSACDSYVYLLSFQRSE